MSRDKPVLGSSNKKMSRYKLVLDHVNTVSGDKLVLHHINTVSWVKMVLEYIKNYI